MNISRKGEQTEKGIKLTTETITEMTREEFETLLVDAFNQKVQMSEKLGLMKSKFMRLSNIELTDEMKELMNKIDTIGELKGLEQLKEGIKETEERIDLISKDLLQLRMIQSEIYKDTNKGKKINGTFIK